MPVRSQYSTIQTRDQTETCPGSNSTLPRSLDAPGTLYGVPRTDLAPPRTIEALPGSFSAPRTGQTSPGKEATPAILNEFSRRLLYLVTRAF
jgi:hypothetical protein